jgi:hypothetical protein
MSHTTHQTDFDPTTTEVETSAHFHHIIREWECKDKQGHSVSLQGAETEVWVRFTDEPEYTLVATAIYPQRDVMIDVNRDGWLEIKQRQRTYGGQWAPFTQPQSVKIDLQPPQKPVPPVIRVLDSDGVSTTIEASIVYPDRDVQDNVIEPSQIRVEVLSPCGDTETGWETLLLMDYPQEVGQFRVPVGDGTLTYQARVIVTNLCKIESEPSEVEIFDVQDTELASSGSHSVKRGCL